MAPITAKQFVICYSVFLVALFGVCCYLMTIVNPELMHIDDEDSKSNASLPKHPKVIDNTAVQAPTIPKLRNTTRDTRMGEHDLVISFIGDEPQANTISMIETSKYTTYPQPIDPMEKPTLPLTDYSKFIAILNENSRSTNIISSVPVKGLRRSVNVIQEKYDDNGKVVVKLVDETGLAIVEIKFDKVNKSDANSRYNVSVKTKKSNKSFKVNDAFIKINLKNTILKDDSINLTSDNVFEYDRTDQTVNGINVTSTIEASHLMIKTSSTTNNKQNEDEILTTSKYLNKSGEAHYSDVILHLNYLNLTNTDKIDAKKKSQDIIPSEPYSDEKRSLEDMKL